MDYCLVMSSEVRKSSAGQCCSWSCRDVVQCYIIRISAGVMAAPAFVFVKEDVVVVGVLKHSVLFVIVAGCGVWCD